ncbi:MAG: DUF998 domain-containing protein [Luteimonas sp.]
MRSQADNTDRRGVAAAIAAWLLFMAAALFAALRDGQAQWRQPVAWLGAAGTAHAPAFNVATFVLPGLLAAYAAWRIRDTLPTSAPLIARIGAWLVLISACGFALQGLLPLDARDLESSASHRHALAWMLWWVAFVPGALSHAAGSAGSDSSGGSKRWPRAMASALLAVAVLWLVTLAGERLPEAAAQRLAFVVWFAWLVLASFVTRNTQAIDADTAPAPASSTVRRRR